MPEEKPTLSELIEQGYTAFTRAGWESEVLIRVIGDKIVMTSAGFRKQIRFLVQDGWIPVSKT